MKQILVPLLVLILSGCGGGGGEVDDPLAGTSWNVGDLAGKGLPPDVAVTMRFHEGRVGGSAGCNSYFASYAVKGDSLRFGPAGLTKMMCPEPQMAVEDAFVAALATVKTFRLTAGTLVLGLADGGTWRLNPAPDTEPRE
jgi:heat shock protein HslJ